MDASLVLLLLLVRRLRRVVLLAGVPPLSDCTLGVVGLHFGFRKLLLRRNRVRFRCEARLCRATEFFLHCGP